MTLDEGILMCEREAEQSSKCAEYGLIIVGKALYAERAMEYRQIVEWLKELQRYREQERKQALCSYDPDEWYE